MVTRFSRKADTCVHVCVCVGTSLLLVHRVNLRQGQSSEMTIRPKANLRFREEPASKLNQPQWSAPIFIAADAKALFSGSSPSDDESDSENLKQHKLSWWNSSQTLQIPQHRVHDIWIPDSFNDVMTPVFVPMSWCWSVGRDAVRWCVECWWFCWCVDVSCCVCVDN